MLNIIAIYPNLSRCYEICKLGNFSMRCVCDPEYTSAPEDYKEIKEFYKGIDFSYAGTLICGIDKPEPDQLSKKRRQCETLEDIHNRVNKAKLNPLPTEYNSEVVADSLLKTAISRCNFSIRSVKKIRQIAPVIAQLEGSGVIKIEHLVEAIRYQMCQNGIAIDLENDTRTFGPGIAITRLDCSQANVQAAIKFLATKLNEPNITKLISRLW